jgi:TRAP-type C4-dicarboxylate transport system permease small subunit
MEAIIKLIDRISNAFGRISGVLMLLAVILVIGEVVARGIFDGTLYITEEYTAYLMVAVTFLGFAYTLKEKGHIRMGFLHKFVKKEKKRLILDLYSFLVGFIVFALITYSTFNFFWDSVLTGTRSMQLSRTYLAIPQFALPLGSFLITLQFASELLKTVTRWKRGETDLEDAESQALGR